MSENKDADPRAFQLPMKNAKTLHRASRLLSDNQQFGSAVALLILAAEETIKAALAFSKFNGLDLDPMAGNEYVKSHWARLRMSKALLTVAKYAEDSVGKFGENAPLDEIIVPALKTLFRDLSTGSIDSEISEMRRWWDDANVQKQRGLYTDIVEGQWHTPASIGLSDYEQARKMVDPLIQGARIVIAYIRYEPAFFQSLSAVDFDSLAMRLEAEMESCTH